MIPGKYKIKIKKLNGIQKNKEGWKIYKEITENNAALDGTWRGDDIEKEWENWNKIVNKILKESLGNIRISGKNKQGIDNEVREMMEEKRKIRKETNNMKDTENKNLLIERRKEIEDKLRKRSMKMRKK